MKPTTDKLHQYKTEDSGKAEVALGGDDDSEFVPEVKIEKFKGRAFLTIRHPDAKIKDKAKEKVKDGKVEVSKGDKKRVHRFYEVDDPSEAVAAAHVVDPVKPLKPK